MSTSLPFDELSKSLDGELYYLDTPAHYAMRKVYATDASVYQELPSAVVIPRSRNDLSLLVAFALNNNSTLIPRAAGTSLAGQVVGKGIVVDISKYFTNVLEINASEKWVRVEPGVIRDDLNALLKNYDLMFGPETSTSNRAMIGGMVGNNSCGLHSIIWGDTRDNLIEVKALLADGSEVIFKDLDEERYKEKLDLPTLEGSIYRGLEAIMRDEENRREISSNFPKASITRRNTGYALDSMLAMWNRKEYDVSKLIAGSEGTLCIILEAKLKLLPLPPPEKGIVAIHTQTIKEALLANLVALHHNCAASELVDDVILEYTKINIDQSKNRSFVEGSPRAILMVEFFAATAMELQEKAKVFIAAVLHKGLGYAHPLLLGKDCLKAWDLRKAGLGLLRNEPGNTQPVNLIEDCAVAPEDLPSYIDEIEALLRKHGLRYSMYAHAGAGELHVEPMINLKTTEGKNLFRTVLAETTTIVKKYNGSLSGEHGDGRLRGEFISYMMGERVYSLFGQVKNLFDPHGIFNEGKIVNTPPMNEHLRYGQDEAVEEVPTVFNFKRQEGILHLAEKCSGSGDCRKTAVSGGTMCPSYMATRSERDTTRARANMLRHFYSRRAEASRAQYEEVNEVLDLCLSCKACKSECPSSVDVGKMKAEFTQAYHQRFGASFRSRLIGNFTGGMKLASILPSVYNAIYKNTFARKSLNRLVGFHPERSMPPLHYTTLRQWYNKAVKNISIATPSKRVYLFCDEFTNYNDVPVGQKLILLLWELGYEVIIPEHIESGRSYLSKGFVKKAKEIASVNVAFLKDLVTKESPIIGIEPSAILTLRDEYLELAEAGQWEDAVRIGSHTFLFDEWFSREIEAGNIDPGRFTNEHTIIKVHGHCHQKALSSMAHTLKCLSLPDNFVAHEIPSGCCGMAGSFGYEKEHYEVSMQIGGLVLFPAIRESKKEVVIAAAGTSCRHQIKDGTGQIALHPAEILYDALKKNQNYFPALK